MWRLSLVLRSDRPSCASIVSGLSSGQPGISMLMLVIVGRSSMLTTRTAQASISIFLSDVDFFAKLQNLTFTFFWRHAQEVW